MAEDAPPPPQIPTPTTAEETAQGILLKVTNAAEVRKVILAQLMGIKKSLDDITIAQTDKSKGCADTIRQLKITIGNLRGANDQERERMLGLLGRIDAAVIRDPSVQAIKEQADALEDAAAALQAQANETSSPDDNPPPPVRAGLSDSGSDSGDEATTGATSGATSGGYRHTRRGTKRSRTRRTRTKSKSPRTKSKSRGRSKRRR